MGLKATIISQVDAVFTALDDLVTTVTFTKNTPISYNLATGTITSNTALQTSIGVVLTKLEKVGDTTFRYIIAKKKDIVNAGFYDTVTIANEVWKLGDAIIENDYIVKIKAYRP